MPNFVLAFRGGMPKTPEEGQTIMEEWNGWVSKLGPALVDPGAGLGKSRFLATADREEQCGDPLSGYSVIEAPDIEAALAIARANPIFSLGGTIEVAEQLKM